MSDAAVEMVCSTLIVLAMIGAFLLLMLKE